VVDEDLDEVFRYIAYIKLHPIYASPSQSLDYCIQEILGIKAVMVNQHKMLHEHDTRRMMTEVKSSYRSMLNCIVSLEREVRSGRQHQAAFKSNTGKSDSDVPDNDESVLKNRQEIAKTVGKDTSPEKVVEFLIFVCLSFFSVI